MKIRIRIPLNMHLSPYILVFPTSSLSASLPFFQAHRIPLRGSATIYLTSLNWLGFQSFASTSNTAINNLYIYYHLSCRKNYCYLYREFFVKSMCLLSRNCKFKIIEIVFFFFLPFDQYFAKESLVFLNIFSLVSI